MGAQFGEGRLDLAVLGHVAGQHDLAAELRREFRHAFLEPVAHIGEGELGALLMTGARDAVGDGTVREHPGDQNAFAGESPYSIL